MTRQQRIGLLGAAIDSCIGDLVLMTMAATWGYMVAERKPRDNICLCECHDWDCGRPDRSK